MPHSVLFVCLGNICRSPMCEAVLSHLVERHNLKEHFSVIDSAGTGSYHVGGPPDTRSVETCQGHGVPVNHIARQVKTDDFHKFNYMFCMDEENLANLKRIQPKDSKCHLQLFGELDPRGETIIKDPYFGGIDGFEHNFQQSMRCSQAFIKQLGLNLE